MPIFGHKLFGHNLAVRWLIWLKFCRDAEETTTYQIFSNFDFKRENKRGHLAAVEGTGLKVHSENWST